MAAGALSVIGQAAAQPCPATPFACEVDHAIDRGLDYLRTLEGGSGTIDGLHPTAHGFLAVLAFIEKRAGIGWNGPATGFRFLPPDDQRLVLRLVRTMIDDDPALSDPNATAFVYVTGGNLMALAAFLETGGPDDVGAQVGVGEAMRNGSVALLRQRGALPPDNDGGWNYQEPQPTGDMSVSTFAVSGLIAAARHGGRCLAQWQTFPITCSRCTGRPTRDSPIDPARSRRRAARRGHRGRRSTHRSRSACRRRSATRRRSRRT